MKPSVCRSCGVTFSRTGKSQKYCGSAKNKIGCAYEQLKKRKNAYFKKHRRLNTPWAIRMREKLRLSESVKRSQREWRVRNAITLRAYARARKLKIKKIGGTHTDVQWESLKKSFSYCCAGCGISERDLANSYSGWRGKLTKDHIVPVSLGGSDDISNLQPLCLSCNSRKGNRVVIALSGGFDPVHIGHVRMIEAAREYGKVVVIVNSDEWLLRKKNYVFMPFKDRVEVLKSFGVETTGVDDADDTVCEALERLRPYYFGNGGDRTTANEKEHEFCLRLGIREKFGLGGGKVRSSSEFLQHYLNGRLIDNYTHALSR